MKRQKRRDLERQIGDAEHHILITVAGGGRLLTVDASMHPVDAMQVLALAAQKLRLQAHQEIAKREARGDDGSDDLIKIVRR